MTETQLIVNYELQRRALCVNNLLLAKGLSQIEVDAWWQAPHPQLAGQTPLVEWNNLEHYDAVEQAARVELKR